MNSEQFAYWLQGFFEMTDTQKLSEKQVAMIKEHLKLVFNKVTPALEKPGNSELKRILKEANETFNEVKRWPRSEKIC